MTPGRPGDGSRRRAPVRGFGLAAGVLATALLLGACDPGSASPSVVPASDAISSPAVGLLTDIDSEGLTRVTGFRLRTEDGAEVQFRLGLLENGAEFPPGHLAEHMATTTRVRVFFRDEGGERVVYRLEDAE